MFITKAQKAYDIIGPKGNEQEHFSRGQNQRIQQFNQDQTNSNALDNTQ
ncbi:MAG: hypothetical protein Q8912_05730 [Bacillota bacterium]|nr:hypothetical protein [Bacillota bacterium]